MIEYAVWQKAKCTDKQQKVLFPVISQMISLAEKARREGLLALEDDIGRMDDEMLALGTQLIVDGNDPESVHEILRSMVYTSRDNGEKLLKGIMILFAVLSIQSGENPQVLRTKLIACLSEKSRRAYFKAIAESDAAEAQPAHAESEPTENSTASAPVADANEPAAPDPEKIKLIGQLQEMFLHQGRRISQQGATEREILDLSALIRSSEKGIDAMVESIRALPGASQTIVRAGLEEFDPDLAAALTKRWMVFSDLLLLDDRGVQTLMRELDNQDLARALKGVEPEIQQLIFRNMSPRAAALLMEDIEWLGKMPATVVEEAQQKILSIISTLVADGAVHMRKPGQTYVG